MDWQAKFCLIFMGAVNMYYIAKVVSSNIVDKQLTKQQTVWPVELTQLYFLFHRASLCVRKC